MSNLLVQTDSPYYQLATASEFCCTKPTILLAAGYVIDTHSPLHVLCSSDSRGHGKAQKFAGQFQHWASLVYRPREIKWWLWQEVCELLPLGALNSTNLSLNGFISFEQDSMVVKL